MPSFTLTPVGGDPYGPGAVDLDPATAPPLTIHAATPVEAGALTGDAFDTTPQQPLPAAAATAAQIGAVGSSLASGHAAQDYARLVDPDGARSGAAAALGGFSLPAMVASGADALTNYARYAGDVQGGAYGDAPWQSQAAIERGMPAAADLAATLGVGGMAGAEEGALGSAGGKAMAADPLADLLAAIDAHAAANPLQERAAHPRSLPADQLASQAPDGHFLAYHGSPALFDRFSLDHLGTGEGVQAQGHGAYFASDQDVGAHYADTYGQPHTRADGSTVNGHMYQVAIPGHPSDYFDQGLSLHEQSPAVRAAAAPLYERAGVAPDARGGNLVYEMRQRALDDGVPFRQVDQHVSGQFQAAGIPGHSYSGEGGAPNYVVFDPSGVRVMKTYANGAPGLPLLAQPGLPAPQGAGQPDPAVLARLLRQGT